MEITQNGACKDLQGEFETPVGVLFDLVRPPKGRLPLKISCTSEQFSHMRGFNRLRC